jgi:hypothetical protein
VAKGEETWRKEKKRGERRRNVATTKVKIKTHENHISVIPIVIPNLDEVRKFAAKLHA